MAVIETSMDQSTLILTINRPEAMNALSLEVRHLMAEAFEAAKHDTAVRAVIVTGAGDRAFSAGADLRERATLNAQGGLPPSALWEQESDLQQGLEFWKPVIAAINGVALGGGCELAMSCDIRVAADHARFGLPEVTRGIIPGAGGTQRLPRLVPLGTALELLMTGRHINAQEAQRIGLVNHVVPLAGLLDRALEIAAEITKNAPLAVMAAKEAAYRGLNTTLQEGLRIENFHASVVRQTDDAREGPQAFIEKREPKYQGR